jgi:hypothetical protein
MTRSLPVKWSRRCAVSANIVLRHRPYSTETKASRVINYHTSPRRVRSMASFPRLQPSARAILSTGFQRCVAPRPRSLHLAPPWLLDDYIPRYLLISSVDASKKRSLAYAHLQECNLCPRLCGVNRYEKTGVCLIGAEKVKVNTVAPHFGEGMAETGRYLNPPISKGALTGYRTVSAGAQRVR